MLKLFSVVKSSSSMLAMEKLDLLVAVPKFSIYSSSAFATSKAC
jgi:hypothetical protein